MSHVNMSNPTSSPNGDISAWLQRAYGLSSPAEAESLYREWAKTFDADLTSTGYALPRRAVEALVKYLSTSKEQPVRIIDAGCGTGLVGVHLAAQESLKRHIVLDGIDLSKAMLDIARSKKTYKTLSIVDLSKPLDIEKGIYDAVICVGTLTKGHVGPDVLPKFLSLLKKDGVLVTTVHEDIFVSGGYEEKANELDKAGLAELISKDRVGMLETTDYGGVLLIMRKI